MVHCTPHTPARPPLSLSLSLSLSEAPDNPLGLPGFVVELPEGVEELVHLPLDGRVARLGGGPGPLRLLDLGLHGLIPAALLRQVGPQTPQLALQLLVPLLQAGRETHARRRRRRVMRRSALPAFSWLLFTDATDCLPRAYGRTPCICVVHLCSGPLQLR